MLLRRLFLLTVFILPNNSKSFTHSTTGVYIPISFSVINIEILKKDNHINVPVEAFEFIKKWEGYKPTPYECPSGYLTVGYGTLITSDTIDYLSPEDSRDLALQHIKRLNSELDSLITTPLSPQQKISLISFSYNLGINSLKRSTLLKRINSGDSINLVIQEFRRWNKIRNPLTKEKEILKGLSLRRESEATLYSSTLFESSYEDSN